MINSLNFNAGIFFLPVKCYFVSYVTLDLRNIDGILFYLSLELLSNVDKDISIQISFIYFFIYFPLKILKLSKSRNMIW